MSQVLVKQPTPVINSSPRNIALGYLFVALLPIGLKLTGLTPVAAWPWPKVLFTIWAPWVLMLVMSALGWLVHLVQRSARRG